MGRVVSTTEARTHFEELMRQVVEDQEPVIVERGGKPQVVMLSVAEYERLKADVKREGWQEALERAIRLGARIRARRGGKPLTPPPEEIIRQMREERGEQLLGLR